MTGARFSDLAQVSGTNGLSEATSTTAQWF